MPSRPRHRLPGGCSHVRAAGNVTLFSKRDKIATGIAQHFWHSQDKAPDRFCGRRGNWFLTILPKRDRGICSLAYFSSVTVWPLLLVSSMMIFSSSGRRTWGMESLREPVCKNYSSGRKRETFPGAHAVPEAAQQMQPSLALGAGGSAGLNAGWGVRLSQSQATKGKFPRVLRAPKATSLFIN